MEADWSVEIGAELPTIVVPWHDSESGLRFVDLRVQPDAITEIFDAGKYPALGLALAVLNRSGSQVFTSKCDAWRVTGDELDELDALDFGVSNSEAQHGVGSYVDVVLRETEDFASFKLHENWLRSLTAALRRIPLPGVMVEFTLRMAQVEEDEGFATTIHLTACGVDEQCATRSWEAALAVIVPMIAHGVTAQYLPPQSSGNAGN